MTTLARLRLILGAFLFALAIPTGALIYQALARIQWESFHQTQTFAKELSTRIETRLESMLRVENARPYTEFFYFNAVSPQAVNLVQRSPLASVPPPADLPGLIGHFHVTAEGDLNVPFLPPAGTDADRAGLEVAALVERQARAARLREVLRDNRLLAVARIRRDSQDSARQQVEEERDRADGMRAADQKKQTSKVAESQAAFDALKAPAVASNERSVADALGQIAELKLERRYETKVEHAAKSVAPAPALRKEQNVLPEVLLDAPAKDALPVAPRERLTVFESELDAYQVAVLASGHLVMFRKVWRNGQREVQGLLFERAGFFEELMGAPFRASALAASARLGLAYQGEVLATYQGVSYGRSISDGALRGTLLHQMRLATPLSDFELVYSIERLPYGPGAKVIGWLGALFATVLCAGLWGLYRLGARQLALTQQQQDFVSAVSHELKTPLTSIRMYGEMLREGWVSEDKRREYYRFIHEESERLTRLINNVLSLARMTRQALQVQLIDVVIEDLLPTLRAAIGSAVLHAGREYRLDVAPAASRVVVALDRDALTQIMLNLVDNALKFSAHAERRTIEITVRLVGTSRIEFAVRDFGPGIPADQRRKVFDLFYRVESGLTRETGGTGIGLALVQRLTHAMHGTVELFPREPGCEFVVGFDCRVLD